MLPVAKHGPLEIFAPEDCRFSFFKSPYAAHKMFSAVDLYLGEFGVKALAPGYGRVIESKSFRTPTPFLDKEFNDYLLVIKPDDSQYVYRMLHIEPRAGFGIGDEVEVGDEIGTIVRSGFHTFWNDACMHVEVREGDDYVRASNTRRLEFPIGGVEGASGRWVRSVAGSGTSNSNSNSASDSDREARGYYELEGTVEYVCEKYSLVSCGYGTAPGKAGTVSGISIDGCFIDGCLSEFGYFGLIASEPPGFPGSALERHGNFHLYDAAKVGVGVTNGEGNAVAFRSLAFTLGFGVPVIKVTPVQYGQKPLIEGEHVTLDISFNQ